MNERECFRSHEFPEIRRERVTQNGSEVTGTTPCNNSNYGWRERENSTNRIFRNNRRNYHSHFFVLACGLSIYCPFSD